MDYEAKLQCFYERILQPSMNVVDVGAHVGRHAFEMVRLVGGNGRVLAYEPIPSLYEGLKKSSIEKVDLKGVLQVFPYALSNSEGVVDFCLAVDAPGYSGMLERVYDTPTRVEHISVETRRLDDLVSKELPISYIKIDTEGAEWNVIQGASNLIKKWRPHISFEFGESSYRNYKVDPIVVFDFFENLNYCLFDINGLKMARDTFVSSSIQQSVWDYIATPEEHSDNVFSILNMKS